MRCVVQRAYQLVVGSGVATIGVADFGSDVWLNNPIHLRIGNKRQQSVDVFEKLVKRELIRANKEGRVKMVLVKVVVLEHLDHVGQEVDVSQKVELHIIN